MMKNKRAALTAFLLLLFPGYSFGATYFVSPNGNDSNSGLSDASAWRTIQKVNSFRFQDGDDIYFKCGGTWTGTQLNPKINGVNEANRSIIGAYYDNGMIGVSGNRPIIDGNNYTVPSTGSWGYLVYFENRSYVTVQDLHVQYSGGGGITFNGTGSHNTIRNCQTTNTYWAGIRIQDKHSNCLIEYNTVTLSAMNRPLTRGLQTAAIILSGNSPLNGKIVMNTIVRYNKVFYNHGEGIGLYKGTEDNIVEFNTCIHNRSASIYFSQWAKRNIARYNLVYALNKDPVEFPYGSTSGISIDDEPESRFAYASSEGNAIYGNLIAGQKVGIALDSNHIDSSIKDTKVFNNTLVDCGCGTTYGPCAIKLLNSSPPFENSYIINNIIWFTGERTDCTPAQVPSNHSGLTIDNNLWSHTPILAARGANDLSPGNPKLTKTSGWSSLTLNSLTGREFAPTFESPVIGAGARPDSLHRQLLNLQASDFSRNLFDLINLDNATAWDIGAGPYLKQPKLAPPKNIQASPVAAN